MRAWQRLLVVVPRVTVTGVAAAVLATGFTAAVLAGTAHATHTTTWKAPTRGASVSGVLKGHRCKVTTSSPRGIQKVRFYVDGAWKRSDYSAPYTCWIDTRRLAEGAHTLTAKAYANRSRGRSTTRSIRVIVDNVRPAPQPPQPAPQPPQPAPQAPQPGKVNYMRIMNSDFESYSSSPTDEQKQWMGDRYWRALVYSPHFDKRTAWFPRGWVYHDAYAIYTD
ncbi:MAG TPA: Ig-like domain-containing protein, partial [Thermoleophilaceae bacterium]|nr:Ig-like domain-containing protein [Thermoleophilaceae bacterium]